MEDANISDVILDMIEEVPFKATRERLASGIFMKEICEIEDFKDELNALKRRLLSGIHEGLSIHNIKLLIIREIRQILNNLIDNKQKCLDKMEELCGGSDDSD